MKQCLKRRLFVLALAFLAIAVLASTPVSAQGVPGPWRDINPTQYIAAGDSTVPGPDVPLNGIYVRAAGFGAVGAGEAWAVGGCGPPSTTAPIFPFSLTGCPASTTGGGTIAYYDGFSWTIMTDPFTGHGSFYTGVNFCTSPGSPGVGLCSPNGDGSDGWIVGGDSAGPIALYTSRGGGTSVPLPAGSTGYLTSVFEVCHVDNDPNGKGCPSGIPGDAYAAGTDGTHGVIYEYSGGAPTGGGWVGPQSGTGTSCTASCPTIYNSIYMFVDSTGNLEGFAAGDNGVIARYYGGAWTTTTVATGATFDGIAVDNANPVDAWAVGCNPCTPTPSGIIYHFSSGSWAGPLAPSPTSGVIYESVDVLSTSEAWIVGTKSTILHSTGLPGVTFQSLSTAGSNPLLSGTGAGVDLNSVNFQSSGNGWAVGSYGVILQTSDSSCSSIVQTSSPSACWGGQTSIEQTIRFNAVYENSPSDAWAGGLYDNITLNGFPSLIHWDGNKWHRATVIPGLGGVTKPDIYGIYMVGGGEGYAVGSENTTAQGGPSVGGATCSATTACPAAFTWNVITPNAWQSVNVAQCSYAAGCGMTSVYFASIGPVDGWAVGTNGGLWTYSKSSPGWSLAATNLPSGFSADLNAVFINNPGNNKPAGWAVGADGTILYLDCSTGTCVWDQYTVAGLSSINLYGIYFTDSNHGWIVGADNTILTTINNGGTWTVGSAAGVPSTISAEWRSVHVDSYGTTAGGGDGWTVGFDYATGDEVMAWWNGASWYYTNTLTEPVAGGLGLYSVFTTSPTDGWAVGATPITTPASVAPLTGIFHLDPTVPPTVTSGGTNSTTTTSSSTPVTTTVSSSSASSNATSASNSTMPITMTSSLTTTVISTSVSTMTVVSTPTTTTSTSTSSTSTPMVLPAIPGFPWESIIAGLSIGVVALAVVRRVKRKVK